MQFAQCFYKVRRDQVEVRLLDGKPCMSSFHRRAAILFRPFQSLREKRELMSLEPRNVDAGKKMRQGRIAQHSLVEPLDCRFNRCLPTDLFVESFVSHRMSP